jgi:protein O-mannosyl-transferase
MVALQTPPTAESIQRRFFFLGALALFIAVLGVYLPTLRNGFVWNDSDYVTRSDLRSVGGLRRIWLQPGATEQYYPVLHTAFWIEHRLWGDSPFGYHLLNVLLHATAAGGFLLVLRRLGVPGAGLAALLFALHPVGVESVAWISEQKNTLSLVFYLAAALAYLRFVRDRRWGPYLLAFGLFLLAILSKSVTATLPATLLVLCWWQTGRLAWRKDVAPLAPWLAIGAGAGLFTAWIERTSIGAQGPEFGLSVVQRVLVAGRAIWFYLGKLAWPRPLIFMYPRWTVDAHLLWQYLFPLAALGVLIACGFLVRRSRAPLTVALLFVGALAPVLGFFNVYAFIFSFVADHFQYLACLPIFGAAAAAWAGLIRRPLSALAVLGVRLGTVGVLGVLGLLTFVQCADYHDEVTLYRSILSANGDSWLAHYNLANILRDSGNFPEAIFHYEETLRIDPGHSGAENNLGLALANSGQLAEAIPHYKRALTLRANYAAADLNLGNAWWGLGHNPEAIAAYQAALKLQPTYAAAWFNLGQSWSAISRWPEATAALAQAVHFQPDFPGARKSLAAARNNWGIALYSSGNFPEAIAQFEQALKLDSGLAEAERNLAIVLRRVGREPEALEHEKAAAALAR